MIRKRATVTGVPSSSPSESPFGMRSGSETSSLGGGQSSDSAGARGGVAGGELDVQRISDEARGQLADILGTVEGKKDIVIQPQLISLLEHITPFKLLKK